MRKEISLTSDTIICEDGYVSAKNGEAGRYNLFQSVFTRFVMRFQVLMAGSCISINIDVMLCNFSLNCNVNRRNFSKWYSENALFWSQLLYSSFRRFLSLTPFCFIYFFLSILVFVSLHFIYLFASRCKRQSRPKTICSSTHTRECRLLYFTFSAHTSTVDMIDKLLTLRLQIHHKQTIFCSDAFKHIN